MGIATLHPLFTGISGRIGGIVFYSYNDVTYFRAYVVPRNPDTAAQRNNRSLFARAMKAWQALSRFDRDSFNRRARRLGMTGHNLFISGYMSRNTGSCAGGSAPESPSESPAGGFHVCRDISSAVHGIGRSVGEPVTSRSTLGANPCRGAARCVPAGGT